VKPAPRWRERAIKEPYKRVLLFFEKNHPRVFTPLEMLDREMILLAVRFIVIATKYFCEIISNGVYQFIKLLSNNMRSTIFCIICPFVFLYPQLNCYKKRLINLFKN